MKNDLSFKQLNKLALPALISGIAEPLLSLTDTAIIGNMDKNATEALAAVGIVGTFISMLIWVFGQSRSALSSIISQYLGGKKLEEVKALPSQAIFIIVSISLLIIVITYPLSNEIFKLYNAKHLILEFCNDYFKIRILGLPLTLFTIGVFGVFRGLQNTFIPMIIAVLGTTLNIILDFVLIYGISDLIDPMHIKGAAIASVISQFFMALLALVFLKKKTAIPLRPVFPINKEMKTFIQMILNLFVRTIALNVALFLGSAFATKYGNASIAAYTIAINIWFLGAFLIDGYSSAGNILSGKFYGAKAYEMLIKLSNKLILYGVSIGLVIMIIGFIFYKLTGQIFTNEKAVLNNFYSVFWIVLIMQPFCAIAFIFDGVFKGLGQVKFLRNLLLISTFVVFVPLLLVMDYFNMKLYAIFWALFFWVVARGIPLVIKFRRQFLAMV